MRGGPSGLEKAKNFVGALVRHAADGLARVDNETLSERLAVCALCEHRELSNWTCRLCGCYLTVKATWRSEKCPEGRWELPMAGEEKEKAPEGGCGCGSGEAAQK